jgi:hypothetical protein
VSEGLLTDGVPVGGNAVVGSSTGSISGDGALDATDIGESTPASDAQSALVAADTTAAVSGGRTAEAERERRRRTSTVMLIAASTLLIAGVVGVTVFASRERSTEAEVAPTSAEPQAPVSSTAEPVIDTTVPAAPETTASPPPVPTTTLPPPPPPPPAAPDVVRFWFGIAPGGVLCAQPSQSPRRFQWTSTGGTTAQLVIAGSTRTVAPTGQLDACAGSGQVATLTVSGPGGTDTADLPVP